VEDKREEQQNQQPDDEQQERLHVPEPGTDGPDVTDITPGIPPGVVVDAEEGDAEQSDVSDAPDSTDTGDDSGAGTD
jgi:hypothetical protein